MFRNFINNLSRNQKIILIIISQILIIGLILLVIQITTYRPNSSDIKQEEIIKEQNSNISNDKISVLKQQLFYFLHNKYNLTDSTQINDIFIRENSYYEKDNIAHFLIDIDSLKATYAIEISLYKDSPNSVLINCPPKDQMKYPETFCEGMYNNTSSAELYLPYKKYTNSQDKKSLLWSIQTSGQKINITTKKCTDQDNDIYYQEAINWLKSTPINLEKYTIQTHSFCEIQSLE